MALLVRIYQTGAGFFKKIHDRACYCNYYSKVLVLKMKLLPFYTGYNDNFNLFLTYDRMGQRLMQLGNRRTTLYPRTVNLPLFYAIAALYWEKNRFLFPYLHKTVQRTRHASGNAGSLNGFVLSYRYRKNRL
jgi:hypothetical protein